MQADHVQSDAKAIGSWTSILEVAVMLTCTPTLPCGNDLLSFLSFCRSTSVLKDSKISKCIVMRHVLSVTSFDGLVVMYARPYHVRLSADGALTCSLPADFSSRSFARDNMSLKAI
jgi:hypothetical protein